jgi:aspartate carbamoyltransferase catalytic subunit
MAFAGRSIIDVHALTRDEIEYILAKAATMKRALEKRDDKAFALARGKNLLAALLFYEDSTRTRSSFAVAAARLGLDSVGFAGVQGTSVKKGESLRHTLDMFEAYGADCIILRHPLDGAARFAAEHVGVPVFNAGDGKHEHPTQTLLDLFTIREQLGKLDDIDVGMGGDLKYGRTVHSLAVALAKFKNVRLHFFSHETLRMPQGVLTHLAEHGVAYTIHDDLNALLGIVDVFYQTRIQKERMPDEEEYRRARDACTITLSSLEHTKKHFGLMHPLPIYKEHAEIAPDVDAHPKAIYKRQAGNGVPTRLVEIALSLNLLGNDFKGQAYKELAPRSSFVRELPVAQKERTEEQTLMPIRDSGTVIDHLIPGTAQKLMYLLKVEERGDIYRGGTVRSRSRQDQLKAMLMIEGRELTEDELHVVAAISPRCRVNAIRGGVVVRKVELDMPEVIEGIKFLKCPNLGCITRPEHHEHVTPKFVRAGSVLRCHYCDTLLEGKELL